MSSASLLELMERAAKAAREAEAKKTAAAADAQEEVTVPKTAAAPKAASKKAASKKAAPKKATTKKREVVTVAQEEVAVPKRRNPKKARTSTPCSAEVVTATQPLTTEPAVGPEPAPATQPLTTEPAVGPEPARATLALTAEPAVGPKPAPATLALTTEPSVSPEPAQAWTTVIDAAAVARAKVQLQLNDRKKAQMAFLRSRQGPVDAYDKGNVKKCPEWLREKIPAKATGSAYEYWFQLWLKCNGNFKAMNLCEKIKKLKVECGTSKKVWMRGDEIDDKFPAAVATALKKTLGGKASENRLHPQIPDCDEAHLYHVLVLEETEEKWHHEHEQILSLAVELGDDIPEEMLAMLPGMFASLQFGKAPPPDGPSVKPEKTKEEIELEAAELERKAREKAQKDAERKAAKEQPLAKCSDYLKKLPKDIGDSDTLLNEARGADLMPYSIRAEYVQTFVKHAQTLKEHRTAIEDIQKDKAGDKAISTLAAAALAVTAFRDDRVAFRKANDAYVKRK